MRATFEATANIAVVKYWGKRDEKLILPTNSNLSFTMDDKLKTRTTVVFSEDFKEDELYLNGQKIDLNDQSASERMIQLDLVRKSAGFNHKARVASINCFPTAAGFASSASGMAALACSSATAANLKLSNKELSILARRGSGSACRSVLGGFVQWHRGKNEDGSDSYASEIFPASHWKELVNVIAVVDSEKKKTSSRSGMKQTILTSKLFEKRLQTINETIEDTIRAVEKRDFESFAKLIIKESNNMHAVMLDTYPPIMYLNDNSRKVIDKIIELNENKGKMIAGYTFDAGPNAHVYTIENNLEVVKETLKEIPGVKELIVCRIGNGPKQLTNESEHLLTVEGKVKDMFFDEKTKSIISR